MITSWTEVIDRNPDHSHNYIERWESFEAQGRDIDGEARLIDALASDGDRILDAGAGTGRLAGYLAARNAATGDTGRNLQLTGVDIDPVLVAAARQDHPDATWLVADLVSLDLAAQGEPDAFDGALLAGNVMDFIPGLHRAEALLRVAAHVRPGGFVLLGCRTVRGFTPEELDALLPGTGLRLEHRFATWDLRPWRDGAPFAVTVLRRP